jgi:hypothetical protein
LIEAVKDHELLAEIGDVLEYYQKDTEPLSPLPPMMDTIASLADQGYRECDASTWMERVHIDLHRDRPVLRAKVKIRPGEMVICEEGSLQMQQIPSENETPKRTLVLDWRNGKWFVFPGESLVTMMILRFLDIPLDYARFLDIFPDDMRSHHQEVTLVDNVPQFDT